MPCVHLKQLFQLCQDNDLKVSSAELIHFVCEKCNKQEVCPTNLMDHSETEDQSGRPNAADSPAPQPQDNRPSS